MKRAGWILIGLLGLVMLGRAQAFSDIAAFELNLLAAAAAYDRADLVEAEDHLAAAVQEIEGLDGRDERQPAALEQVARFYRILGRYGKAERLLDRVREARESTLGADHPYVATTLNDLAQLHQLQSRHRAAEPLFKRALAIYRASLGPHHAHVGTLLNNLAELYHPQGRYEEAEPLYRAAIEVWQEALGADHRYVANALENYAALLRVTGRGAEAQPLEARARGIRSKSK